MNLTENRAEFEQLLRRHERQVFGYIFSLVRNLADTEDLFQETCIASWEQFDRFEPGTNFAAWLCAIARFRVFKFLERDRRPQVEFSDAAHSQLLSVAAESSSEQLEARRDALALCVEKLSPRQQQLVQECYGRRQGVAEVAARTKRTTHSIYSSLRHIRSVLLQCIERTLARGNV